MNQGPFRRERPRLPIELADATPEEYADMLRAGGYSEKLIGQELEKLAKFQGYIKKPAGAAAVQELDESDPIAQAASRRRNRERAEPQDE